MVHPSLEQQQQEEIQLDPSSDEEALYAAARENNGRDSTSTVDGVPNPEHSPIKLLHVSFNQDYSRFASGTNRGFRCYTCDPFTEIIFQDLVRVDGGVGAVEMLFHFNILALVGGGDAPQYPLNEVMIWNKPNWWCIDGRIPFNSEVRGVRLRRDQLVVVLEKKILVHDYWEFKRLHEIETIANPKGLCAVSQVGDSVMVCPGSMQGQVRVENYSSKRTKHIIAHESEIATIALSQDGNLLATASTKGTLVRIFNTRDGSLLQEVRRGADRAEIYSLAFSPTAEWLAVSSDKGTIHVFGLTVTSGNVGEEGSSNSPEPNPSVEASSFSMSLLKGVLPKYFSSEWSLAQFHLPEGSQYIVGFGQQKNTVLIVGLDGSFYRCKFDPVTGGEMTQLEYHNFLEPDEAVS